MNFLRSLSLPRLGGCSGARHYRFQIPGEFVPCNPSLVADGDGFVAIVRTVNYHIGDDGYYRVSPEVTSINWLLRLDKNFRVIEADVIDDAEAHRSGLSVRHGLEDCRLFRWRDSWWFAAAAKSSFSPLRYTVALCRLEGSRVAECRFVPSPLGLPVEKNWMPRVLNDELAFVYRVSPTQIVYCTPDGSFEFHVLTELAIRFAQWSGSTQLVPYGGNWLCVVHRRVRDKRPHHYLNAFVEFDRDFQIMRSSGSWVFEAPTIEFCSGLCVTGGEAIIGYGVWDREARLLRIPMSAIEEMLNGGSSGVAERAAAMFRRLAAPVSPVFETIAVSGASPGSG